MNESTSHGNRIREMRDEVESISKEIKRQTELLETRKAQLHYMESRCPHDWEKSVNNPVYHEPYTIPGDRPGDPGYGGVDRRFDTHVPARTEDKWTRTCKLCGKVEKSNGYVEETVRKPRF